MLDFSCHVLAYDKVRSAVTTAWRGEYLPLNELLSAADVISLHCLLTPETHYLINTAALTRMKPGAYLLNTSRGSLLDTHAVLTALESGQLGALGMDIYELEDEFLFNDWSGKVLCPMLT